ncbi:MAG: hypothetical protein WC824_02915 [Bacteroidota bacterium]
MKDLREVAEFFSETKDGRAVQLSWFPTRIAEMHERIMTQHELELLDALGPEEDASKFERRAHQG